MPALGPAPVQGGGERSPEALSVVVVAGTQVRQRQLERLLSGPGFLVGGGAKDAASAEQLVRDVRPAAVLVDLDLFAGGLEVIEGIMARYPTPIVVSGAAAEHPEAALAAGAVDVVGGLDVPPASPAYAEVLRRHLSLASRVRVITHPRARLRSRSSALTPLAPRRQRTCVVAVGASTGGPPALATLLGDLPADLPAAVVVVQHMAEGFVEGLARWLDGVCPLPVVVAVDGERLRAGTVYLAPAGFNLLVRPGLRLALAEPPPTQYNVPGVDATFASVADVVGPSAVGVLLTGMGRDGAMGLSRMRTAGAFTIGQDEATSVVWGMPAAAQALDAVDLELPLPAIAANVVRAVSRVAPVAEEA
ncbi:MAG TPA: chemotaxis protein CheB [Actinomycetes bacterium]|nr:chemotaxis protein CheB [Actinomycetes bacterium]